MIERADRERERDRQQRVPRVQHRRVDHHARVQQQRIEPGALQPAGSRVVANGLREEHRQRDEERARSRAARRSRTARSRARACASGTGSGSTTATAGTPTAAASPPARTRPRSPCRTSASSSRSAPATTLKEKSERRNAASRIANASVISPASAYTERRPESTHSAPAAARAVERRADAVDGDQQPEDQQGATDQRHQSARQASVRRRRAWYLDGHLVVSEFCWPMKLDALLVDRHEHAAAGARTGRARSRCSGPAPTPSASGRAPGTAAPSPSWLHRAVEHRAGQDVGLPGLGARSSSWRRGQLLAAGGEARVDRAPTPAAARRSGRR